MDPLIHSYTFDLQALAIADLFDPSSAANPKFQHPGLYT